MIIPFIILAILLSGGVWSIWKAFSSNEVEYGYKYYPPKYVSGRKTDPFGFWLAVTLYALSVMGCIFLMIFIWKI
jgi:hypothetical protein